VLARHLARALLVCGLLAATAAPASAQTREPDAVALARTLADGFTAIDAHSSEARAAVAAWYADQGRCAEPHLPRRRRPVFTAVRRQALHAVALQALAPELAQLSERLRALPVTYPAIRGGIREVLLDYRNAREVIDAKPPSLCRLLRSVRAGTTNPLDAWSVEDLRGSFRALERRGRRLRAAQGALLEVEVDPRLAGSLDTVFEFATAGLYRSRLELRPRLAPPFAIVTDAEGLERLRAEAASVAAAAETMLAARRDVSRRVARAVRRAQRCDSALVEGAKRRPNGVFALVTAFLLGEVAAAAGDPVERFLADLGEVEVTDPAMRDLLKRTTAQLSWLPDMPRTNLCSKLRAWRRAGWSPGAIDVGADPFELIDSESGSGIWLDDEVADQAVLLRRGVSRDVIVALLSPLETLVEEPDQSTRTQAVASSVRPASAAEISRGVWRRAQAISAAAIGSAGAR
jgi:hypothetical protein